jgi:hypothetical protein
VDGEAAIHGDTQPHLVQRLAGRDRAPPVVAELVGLGVGQMALDVEQATLAFVAGEVDVAGVDVFAIDGWWQWHGTVASCKKPPLYPNIRSL